MLTLAFAWQCRRAERSSAALLPIVPSERLTWLAGGDRFRVGAGRWATSPRGPAVSSRMARNMDADAK
jgi:hypothetical protein